ncbi:putative helicase chr10 [Nicotiana attenuata]|uniref:Helicase chr10 n=1 Tax=Nicotiana attenuata TaxID=49451 RepID=A0A1J6IWI7_NICAT|nr:putative helicase chr10 [Nicotiana attenuata]
MKEALNHSGWSDAMLEEIHALEYNHMWDLVDLPKGKKPVGCKWVFTVKVNPDGSVARLKARLVAKGSSKKQERDSLVPEERSQTYRIECFADVDWAGSRIDKRSAIGYRVFVGGNLGILEESEYSAMAQSACEILWIHHLLAEVGLKPLSPAKLLCDNPVYHERTEHIEVDSHFIGVQVLGKVPSPSLEDAYSYVQQEERRRGVMLYSAPMEKSGLTMSHEQPKAFTFDKDHMHCDYCGKPRHTNETCWKLHGRRSRGHGRKRVANLDWDLQQFDVKNAILHGDLEEEVYMDIPPGFDTEQSQGKITLSIRHQSAKLTLLIVYVDVIVMEEDDKEELTRLKNLLAQEFEIKDLGKLQYFLGIEVARSKRGIFISQRKYVLDLLKETGMIGCKPTESPIECNHKLQTGVGESIDKERYQRLVGRLIYLSHTRPDIAYSVSLVIQLRKACSHPYLFAGIEPEPYEEGEHLVQASGKLLIVDHLLQKLHAHGHRVLLFAQMTQTLDILQDYLELRKYSYERLDGSIRAEERFAAIRSFSQQSAKRSSKLEADQNGAFVFLISTRAGGVGLNLVAADTVIFYEQDWNPQVDRQALQRAHRIGQTNHVLSINLVTEQTVEEVIMRRAQRKLQLSQNIVGDDVLDQEGKEMAGAEAGDLQSVILGLHMLDPAEITNEESDEFDRTELTAMAETIIAFRNEERSAKDEFEVKPVDRLSEFNVVTKRGPESIKLDPRLDEASYLAWVEKFKEASQANHGPIFELGNRRRLPEEKHVKTEAAKRKEEEEKLSKWEALGYHSLSVRYPVSAPDTDISSDSGVVHFVYGDCTYPSKVSPSEPTIIFSCVDTSGSWGHGGMFDALARLSSSVPAAYERASEFHDLHLGDLHLIEITEDLTSGSGSPHAPQWVALAVVQSYNPRRKVPRGSISIPDLEHCLSKASYSAAQKSASIHMPRIGYQDGSDRSEWYTIERLLRKHAALYGINIFVYYFRRSAQS